MPYTKINSKWMKDLSKETSGDIFWAFYIRMSIYVPRFSLWGKVTKKGIRLRSGQWCMHNSATSVYSGSFHPQGVSVMLISESSMSGVNVKADYSEHSGKICGRPRLFVEYYGGPLALLFPCWVSISWGHWSSRIHLQNVIFLIMLDGSVHFVLFVRLCLYSIRSSSYLYRSVINYSMLVSW